MFFVLLSMKNSPNIFFAFLLFSIIGYTQTDNPKIDSLIQKAIQYGTKNQDSALFFSKQAYEIANHQRDTFLIGSTGYYYSFYLISANKIKKAESVLQFNLDNQHKLNEVLNGNTFYNKAAIHDLNEEFDKALQYYLTSIDFYQEGNNKKGLSKAYLQTGVIYEKLKKLNLADYFFDLSIEVSGYPKKEHIVDSLNRGMSSAEKVEGSKQMLEELETSDNKKLKAIVYYNLGYHLLEQKKYKDAINYLENSLNLKNVIGLESQKDKTLIFLGKGYLGLNNTDKAIIFFKEALALTQKRQQKAEIQKYISEAYEKKQDYKNALVYSNKYKRLTDSIAQFKENERIAEITAKYETEKQAKEILQLKQENQEKNLLISQKENKIWRWSLAALVAVLASVWLGRRYMESLKRVKEVEHEKEVIAKKVEQIALILNNKSKIYLDLLKFIKSDGNYLEFVTEDKTIIDRNKLKDVLEELPPNFVRVHRSYVINKNFIESQNSTTLFLQPNIEIPLSRTFKSNLR